MAKFQIYIDDVFEMDLDEDATLLFDRAHADGATPEDEAVWDSWLQTNARAFMICEGLNTL